MYVKLTPIGKLKKSIVIVNVMEITTPTKSEIKIKTQSGKEFIYSLKEYTIFVTRG